MKLTKFSIKNVPEEHFEKFVEINKVKHKVKHPSSKSGVLVTPLIFINIKIIYIIRHK